MPLDEESDFPFFLFKIFFRELITNGKELIRYRFQAIVYINH